MARFLQLHFPDREIHYLFQNTGKEHEETLKFVLECDRRWDLRVVWLEADVRIGIKSFADKKHIYEMGRWQKLKSELARRGFGRWYMEQLESKRFPVGTRHKQVDFESASRNGEPYENAIKKYGLANMVFTHCTRELKIQAGRSYIKNELGLTDYEIAIGIRADETHRINREKQAEYKTVYPLVDIIQVNKKFINNWWAAQDFNLNLALYLGNCDMCFKKSIKHLVSIVREQPERLEWWEEMEKKYSLVNRGNGDERRIFRGQRTAQDLRELAKEKPSLFENNAEFETEYDCFCKSN